MSVMAPGGPYRGETVTWMDASGQSHTTTYDSNGNPTTSAGTSQATVDGKTILQNFLNQYGLTGINLDSAWSAYVSSGSNIDYWSNTWLPQQAAFKAAFPAYDQLMKEGRGITVADYRNYQLNAYAQAHAAGFPDGVVNQNTITNWLLGGVNAQEAQQRIQDASAAVHQLDKNAQSYLTVRELGLTDNDLAAAFFDPNTALPVLENKLKGAQIGGAALNAGIDLNTGLASDLVNAGVSQSQAQTGFGAIANQQQLYQALPGQQGPTLTQEQQVGAQFGTNPGAAQQVKNTAAQRTAVFKQGGGVASTSQGFVGAGVARGA